MFHSTETDFANDTRAFANHRKRRPPIRETIRQMASTDTYEYVSTEWLDAVQSIITDLLQGHDLSSLDYVICEDLTSPPVDRANTPAGTLSWFIHIHGNSLEARAGSVSNADIRVVADYATHHELSRRVWAGDPEAIAVSQHQRQIATASGKLRIEGDLRAAPPTVLELIAQLHDPVAAITA
ncbi:hypothetical protein ACQP06_24910 [Nocardia sp. CA-136227]|uniref:hypothetical protein n=1 Tax=Nocardia sp. CA-136227 TaxID=3239979 RepID=UPI003D99255A